MSNLDGRYDDDCEAVLRKHNAKCVLLIVIGGDKGQGFSASMTSESFKRIIPEVLRGVAEDIAIQNVAGGGVTQ